MLDLQNMSPDEIRKLAASPGMKLMMELSRDNETGFADPDRIEKVIQWTRSFKIKDPQYNHPESIKMDLRHLGFFNDDGTLKWDVVEIAKTFIDTNLDEEPRYIVLWRHLNEYLGRVQPVPKKPDYSAYNEFVAELTDKNTTLLDMTKAIVKASKDGLTVPTFPLWKADRIQMIIKTNPNIPKSELENELSEANTNWFSPDSIATTMREILKDQNYGLGEEEVNAWLNDQGEPSIRRQLRSFFGHRNKAQTLRDLSVLDKNWQWSEVGFQRFQEILKELKTLENNPNLCLMRWKLFQRYHEGEPIPFEWTLMNDRLNIVEIHRAQRIASIALSGGMLSDKIEVDQTLTTEQYDILRKVGAWLHGQPKIDQWPSLKWLGLIARVADQHFNWENWIQICSFVFDKLNRIPEPELIQDWQEGIVTFEGRGRFQEAPAKPFKANKIGRNEPCPCQSGKKYKKCCGR
jgi:hypothetical protein